MMTLPASLPPLARNFAAAYDPQTGGYLAPVTTLVNQPFSLEDVEAWRTSCVNKPMWDCVELEVAAMLYSLVRMTGARAILETGCSRGFSASFLGAGVFDNGGGQVVTVDINDRFHLWQGSSEVEPIIRFVQSDSQRALGAIEGMSFDLMFLDSLHTYQHLMTEIMIFDRLLKVGGSIVLHDTLHYDALGAVVYEVGKNPRFDAVTLTSPRKHDIDCRRPGITIMTKISDDRERHPLKLSQEFLHLDERNGAIVNGEMRDKMAVPYYGLLKARDL